MKIGIIGAGSVGLLVGSYLSACHDVTVYVRREEQCELLENQGIIESQSGLNFSVKARMLDNMQGEDLLILCVKQQHIPSILPMITRMNSKAALLFLQNGMSHIDFLGVTFQPVFLGINSHGSLRKEDNIFSHTGRGALTFAHYNTNETDAIKLKQQLDSERFPVCVTSDWANLLKEKLIVNAVINPLTALFKVSNGKILSNPHLYDLAKGLCLEAAETLELQCEESWERVQGIAEMTSENTSSMLKDLIEQRPTENEAISGYILSHAKERLPYTRFVYQAIKALEHKNSHTI